MDLTSAMNQIIELFRSQGEWVPKAIIFGSVFLVIVTIGQIFVGIERRVASRVRTISAKEKALTPEMNSRGLFVKNDAGVRLPKFVNAIIPKSDVEQSTLQTRLSHAGYYSPEAIGIYYMIKFSICIIPILFAVILMPVFGFSDLVLLGTIALGIIGLIGPTFVLDYMKADYQYEIRKALPDAMDLLVVCVEGGMSLQAAVKKIATELRAVHPRIAVEFTLVHLQTQMGMNVAKAIEVFGIRTDLNEIRQLAHVIGHSEKLGSSMAKTLRTSADSLRLRRQQQAEAKAQKAAVKIMIPTVLFIFPALFVVVLGPAMFHLSAMFSNMKN